MPPALDASGGSAAIHLSSLLVFDPATRQAVARAHKIAAQSKSTAWRCAEATKRIAAGLQAAAEATEELRAALQGEILKEPSKAVVTAPTAATAGSEPSSAAISAADATATEDSPTGSALAAASQAVAQAHGVPSTEARAAVLDQLCDAAAQLQLVADAVQVVCCEPLLAAQRRVSGGALLRRDTVQRTERELCDVLQGYGRQAKKDAEKQRFENNMKVYNARRAYHHALLDYAVDLNAITAEKSAAIDEPAIFLLRLLQQHGIMHSDGRSSTGDQTGTSSSAISPARHAAAQPSSGQGGTAPYEDVGPREAAMRTLEKEIEQQRAAAVQQLTLGRKYADNIKATTEAAYHPDLDPDDPFVEAQPREFNPKLDAWRNYAMQRIARRKPGSARWRLVFVDVCDGVLSITPGNELAPTERHSLHEAETSLEPSDDRLFVFRVRLKGARKRAQLTFQAANDFDRRQWLAVLNNAKGKATHQSQAVVFSARPSLTSDQTYSALGDFDSDASEDYEETDVSWETSTAGEMRIEIQQNRGLGAPRASEQEEREQALAPPARPPPPRSGRRSNPFDS